jgi:hypothetical protein
MSVGVAAFLLVLVVLVAFGAASFFQHKLAALLVLLGIPLVIVLTALVGAGSAVFAIGLLAIATLLIHTISDTLSRLRAANRAARRTAPTQGVARRRPSEWSRAA